MLFKIVIKGNKIVVMSVRGFKVYAIVGRIVSSSNVSKMMVIKLNQDLLGFWLSRGAQMSTRVVRLLDGIQYVGS